MARPITRAFTAAVVILSLALAACATNSKNEQEPEDDVLARAYNDYVHAEERLIKIQVKSPGVITVGSGVWLGNGEVLTALHLFVNLKEADEIKVIFSDQDIPARVAFHGDLEDFDLALLQLDADKIPAKLATLARPAVCQDREPVGAKLYVSSYDAVFSTYASPEGAVMSKGKEWSRSTTALLSHGVSGSPVFDKQSSCLAGIVSRQVFSPHGNSLDPRQVACEKATLEMSAGGPGVTCAVSTQTIFSTADAIASFLEQAREYKRVHGIL